MYIYIYPEAEGSSRIAQIEHQYLLCVCPTGRKLPFTYDTANNTGSFLTSIKIVSYLVFMIITDF